MAATSNSGTKQTPGAASQLRDTSSTHVPHTASDKETLHFVQGVLCPSSKHNGPGVTPESSINDLLPPLTSSNELDVQLYAFIAIIVRECVQTWYARFTPDQTFTDEIIHIIAHCTRGLEERARKINLEVLLLDDIPALLDAHVATYRTSISAAAPSPDSSPVGIYYALRPHLALRSEGIPSATLRADQQHSEFRSYRHLLAQGLLAVLLPPGDLQNPCLRALVSEVSADLVIGNFIGTRFCESSFIYDTIRKAADIVQPRLGHSKWAVSEDDLPKDRLSKFGLLSRSDADSVRQPRTLSDILALWCQYLVLGLNLLRTLATGLLTASSLPSRRLGTCFKKAANPESPVTTSVSAASATSFQTYATAQSPKPMMDYSIFEAISRIGCFHERMPWLHGLIQLARHLAGKFVPQHIAFDGPLDRLLTHHLHPHITTLRTHLPALLHTLRHSLFPHNSFPPTQPTAPTPAPEAQRTTTHSDVAPDPILAAKTAEDARRAETNRAKRAAGFAVLNCFPRGVAEVYLNPIPAAVGGVKAAGSEHGDAREREQRRVESMVLDIEKTLLDPFGDERMNRHFVLAVLELVLVSLCPELGRGEMGRGVEELLGERGVDVGVDGDGQAGYVDGGGGDAVGPGGYEDEDDEGFEIEGRGWMGNDGVEERRGNRGRSGTVKALKKR